MVLENLIVAVSVALSKSIETGTSTVETILGHRPAPGRDRFGAGIHDRARVARVPSV
jgi:hypothetical protein